MIKNIIHKLVTKNWI